MNLRVISRMLGLFLYVYLLFWWCTITQPEGCLVLEVRILFKAKLLPHVTSICKRTFIQTGSFPNLEESIVHGWKNENCTELSSGSRKIEAPNESINELSKKWQGRPLLLGKEMEEQVKWFLKGIRQSGGAVNLQIVIMTAKGVVMMPKDLC